MKAIRKTALAGILILTVAAGLLLTACGSSESSAVRMDDLKQAMLTADSSLPEMEVAESTGPDAEVNFTLLCDYDYSGVEEYFYAYTKDGSLPEAAAVKLKDASEAAALMAKIREHAVLRQGMAREYAPEAEEMVKNYVLIHKGPYVGYAVSSASGLIQDAFEKTLAE